MAEPDIAALVETVRDGLWSFFNADDEPCAALDALAQRLADAERDVAMLRSDKAESQSAVLISVRQLDAAEARATRAEEALREIESGEVPCAVCGKVHHVREDPERPAAKNLGAGMTWADPEDGHPYYRMAADAVARAALTPHRGA